MKPKPHALKTLKPTIASRFQKRFAESELDTLRQQFHSLGKVALSDNKVTYVM